MEQDPSLALRLVLLAFAVVVVGLTALERTWMRRNAPYTRALALRRLDASLEALAPTRTDAKAAASPTYRAPPRVPFVDLARLPIETALPDGGQLWRLPGRAEWFATTLVSVGGDRRARRSVWLGLRLVDDEVRIEARSVSSISAVLVPFLVPPTLALFTTASLVVVVLSFFFTLGLIGLVSLGARGDHERLARAALIEIEHALAETDESPPEDEAPPP